MKRFKTLFAVLFIFSGIACVGSSPAPVDVVERSLAPPPTPEFTLTATVPPVDIVSRVFGREDIVAFVAWVEGQIVPSSTAAKDIATARIDQVEVNKLIAMIDRADIKEILGFATETQGNIPIMNQRHKQFWATTVLVAYVCLSVSDSNERLNFFGEFLSGQSILAKNMTLASMHYLLSRDPERAKKYRGVSP